MLLYALAIIYGAKKPSLTFSIYLDCGLCFLDGENMFLTFDCYIIHFDWSSNSWSLGVWHKPDISGSGLLVWLPQPHRTGPLLNAETRARV